ncbi:hypothetical protein TorRG33x02_295860 [Trema orientale]|uniref:Uncharacterized protein n=1 Tax=Trema orientale TaxID=63057 RepID=A0A2P5C6L9_TREOI|nr:hypothetical protein TorRG33x02_295860 [Trema orientale]
MEIGRSDKPSALPRALIIFEENKVAMVTEERMGEIVKPINILFPRESGCSFNVNGSGPHDYGKGHGFSILSQEDGMLDSETNWACDQAHLTKKALISYGSTKGQILNPKAHDTSYRLGQKHLDKNLKQKKANPNPSPLVRPTVGPNKSSLARFKPKLNSSFSKGEIQWWVGGNRESRIAKSCIQETETPVESETTENTLARSDGLSEMEGGDGG